MTLSTSEFNTESCCDSITVGGTRYAGTSGPSGVVMSAGDTMTWNSDGSVTQTGFTICGTASNFSTSASSSQCLACASVTGGLGFSGCYNSEARGVFLSAEAQADCARWCFPTSIVRRRVSIAAAARL